ncbi:MAG TPA: caspase family protein [Phycisphaerales bacterium]|nr:caspase family protein [Phycisphaerales bacterium]
MAKRALCIGINDYPGMNADLSGCVNDVHDWKGVLSARGFGVTTLLDRDATKSNMVEAMTKLFSDTKKGDTAILQYSGHGSFVADTDGDEPDGRDEVLCPSDIGSDAFILDDELYELFGLAERGSKLIFFSDSCHSGTITKFRATDAPSERATRSRFLPPSMFLREFEMPQVAVAARSRKRKAKVNRAVLISGCMDEQTSADAWFGSRANGAFTYYALKALKEIDANANYRQWHGRIREYLPSVYYGQAPNLQGTATQLRGRVLD